MLKPRNAVPSIKDKKINFVLSLAAMPALNAPASNLFRDPDCDYQVVEINVLVVVDTTAVASPFELGYGAYTDSYGTIQPYDGNAFLDNSNCLDNTGQPFSTGVLPAGTMFAIPLVGQVNLYAGAPLTISGTSTGNTGQCMVTVTLRPKEKDRNDYSKRPSGAADAPYPAYYK